ncbi:MAG: ribokinase, partial [Frankiales bacterium]|nr:ribokinase [Frankiales bacterium]
MITGEERVVVVGSANVDLVLRVERIPAPGETVTAASRALGPGGKGANQAVAAARSGAVTAFLGAVGKDAGGDLLAAAMQAAEVDVSGLRVVDRDTGAALVVVDAQGENTVVVEPGANAALTGLTDQERERLASAAVVLCQLEIPLARVAAALAAGRDGGALTILNAAPAAALPDEVTRVVDVLIVNEHEARLLSRQDSVEDAVRWLVEQVREV